MSDVRAAAAGVGGDLQRSFRVQDFATPGVIVRERSFMRSHSHNHNHHLLRDSGKRRSMILAGNAKFKPTLEIYRPPGVRAECPGGGGGGSSQACNKLNVHAKEFTMARHNELQTSRSSMNVAAAMAAGAGGTALQQSRSLHAMHAAAQQLQSGPPAPHQHPNQHYRTLQMLATANALHKNNNTHSTSQASTPRVHFKLQPGVVGGGAGGAGGGSGIGSSLRGATVTPGGLQRSKSLTSADALASGMAALGLAADAADLGPFPPDVQENIDKVMADPNAVCARTLMSVVGAVVGRAAESPRYALPAARRCIAAVEREDNETFLESLLNTCQQWYQEREKLLGQVVSGGRPRLMAFLSFLLEMYCQLRRRSLQQSAPHIPRSSSAHHVPHSPPARTLLTLICKCCEDCIRQPVPSASDTENLFFVLTYIGRDLEQQLPGELEALLAAVRDAFLNPSAAPSIRKTLLQLIELHASKWQLPGCAVLYYYPSSK